MDIVIRSALNLAAGVALVPMPKAAGEGGGLNSLMTTKIMLVRNIESQ